MKKYILTALCVAVATLASAIPAKRGWQTRTQADGTTIEVQQMGDEFYHYMINRDGQRVRLNDTGMYEVVGDAPTATQFQAMRKASKRYASATARRTPRRNLAPEGLVILVNFSDSKFNSSNTQAQMDSMMNGANYKYNGAYGSARKYFYDQSEGKYNPHFIVVGPVTVSHNSAYYGSNDSNGDDQNPAQLIVDACKLVDSQVDFSEFDNDNDGEIDFVYVIYAGKGEADGGAETTIWPHNWYVKDGAEITCTLDGKTLNNYACSGELNGKTGARNSIGTPSHEFGHVLGLPDYYDTEYGTNHDNGATPGEWSIMDGGSYNDDGNTPPNYSIYDKYYLGWHTPVALTTEGQSVSLIANGATGYEGYQLSSSYTSLQDCDQSGQMYYIENRQQSGWDAALPGHGLIIWSVNYDLDAWEDNEPNNSTLRYTVVSATGSTKNIGKATDPFPGTNKVTSWTKLSGRPLKDITESNGVITLTYIEVPTNPTVTWMVDGEVWKTDTYEAGDVLEMPTTAPTTCEGTSLIGWTEETDWADPFVNPTDLFTTADGKTVTKSVTYNAVMQ